MTSNVVSGSNDGVVQQIIFDTAQQFVLFGLYGLILILGLTSNTAMIWVILGEY